MKKKVKNFSIVIPTYKENDNFISLLEAIYKYNKQIRNQFELIFVDDNSGDGIAQNFKKKQNIYKNIKLYVRKDLPRDLSKSCLFGFDKSKFDNILVMDADMQHHPKYISRLVNIFFKNNCDFVIGCRNFTDRKKVGLGFFRFFSSKFLNYFIGIFFGKTSKDPMSGFFIFKKSIYINNKNDLFGQGYKILLDLILSSKKQLKIIDLPIQFNLRKFNQSKMSFKILCYLVKMIVNKYYNKHIKL